MPSWSLSEPFCSTSWSMAVYLSSSPSCLATCRLAVVLSTFGWFDTSHYFVKFKVFKARFMLKSRRTGLWRLGLFAEVRLWRRYPLVEEIIFYIDKFKSCTLRRHLSFSDFGCILCHVIIVLCIVFVQCLVSTLQMQRHCIHVAFERGC